MPNEPIDTIVERVRHWPADRQADAVALLLAMEAESAEPYRVSATERADLEAALAEIEHGEVAADEAVQEVFARYRR